MQNFLKQIGTLMVAGSMFVTSAAFAGIVTNGGFESGYEGWQQLGSTEGDFVDYYEDHVHGGEYAAFFGANGAHGGVSQSIQTTVGQTYSLKFWLSNLGGGESNENSVSSFMLSIGDRLVPAYVLDSKSATLPTLYDITFIASSSETNLGFSFRHDDSYWTLDDVSVDAVDGPASVPEPGTLALLGSAFAALRLTRTRRVRSKRGA